MVKIIKTVVSVVAVIAIAILFSALGLWAWDNNMSDMELLSLLEKYPNETKLIKIAENRGYYDGSCDFSSEEKLELLKLVN